jgi:hypothetical protein
MEQSLDLNKLTELVNNKLFNSTNETDDRPKAPEGNVKKHYAVGCYTAEDWEYIHEILMKDGTLEDNIPCDCVECTDLKEHSDTRAVYLLTDTEAEELRSHPKVKYVNYDPSAYPGEFPKPTPASKFARYSENERQYRDFWNNSSYGFLYNSGSQSITGTFGPTGSILPAGDGDDDETHINRSGYQLTRCTEKTNKWWRSGSTANGGQTEGNVEQHGDGTGVDVIVGDEGFWIGHPEFVTTGYGPQNFVGGNVLNNSTDIGVCNVLDLVLDAPYYIDPAWFNANPGTRLTTRWDGTTVPVESVARSWWSNSAQRSAAFSSIGTISINSAYTRAACNGTNTNLPTIATTHGTQCAGAAFGRTQGWAYNANKWVVNVYGSSSLGTEEYFDMLKLFHQNKPNNTTYGNKNPTICSNSFGQQISYSSLGSGFYWFRQSTNGVSGTAYSLTSGVPNVNFLKLVSDQNYEVIDNSTTQAGDEMIAAGVIFVVASGNSAIKQVNSNHPDYNNYTASSNNTPLLSATYDIGGVPYAYRTTNRRGFPGHVGKYTSGGQVVYPTVNIGALDDDYQSNDKERKVNYSSRGNGVDCYTPGDGTLTAVAYKSVPVYDSQTGGYLGAISWPADEFNSVSRTADNYSGNTVLTRDDWFNGTSSACPVACGLIATKLQYNRTWTWQDVKNWITGTSQPTGITTVGWQSSDDFYYGVESSTATTTNWLDYNGLEGGAPIILWDAPTGNEPKSVGLTFS